MNKNQLKKMEKDIQLIIKDLKNNGELSNNDILNNKQEIIETIKDILTNLSDNLNQEINILIEVNLEQSLVIENPVYGEIAIINLIKQIEHLKTIPQPEQRTPEWYEFRNNRLTASDLGSVLGMNPYSNLNSVLKKKCGAPDNFVTNKAIKMGIKYEEVICKIYEFYHEVKIFEYGCIPHPVIKHFGASPDGIVEPDSINKNFIGRMLEIKCPLSRPITGFIPKYYYAQVQGQLEVCNLEYCDFVECKIHEYQTREEYLNDFLSQETKFLYNSIGLIKGLLIEAFDRSSNKETYFYADIGLNETQIDEWIEKIYQQISVDSNLEGGYITYYKAIEYNELLIKRDKKWFDTIALPQINKFWEDVEKNRKNPDKKIFEKKNKKNNDKKILNLNESEDVKFLFLSDSDDD